jgi:catechol 2,3-dioxygenase-like lactoylglutathione lyase family enzyme
MLQDKDAVANLAVKNMDAARKFYEGTLGLRPIDSMGDDMVAYRSGATTVNVYRSDYAGTNKATAVTWAAGDDIERVVRELKAKGVAFEHYDLPDMQRDGDLHIGDGMKVAWFKDPDGNILNIVTG